MKNFIQKESQFLMILLAVVLSAIIAASGILLVSKSVQDNRYENNYHYGQACMDAGEYTAAVAAFEQAYGTKPTHDAAVALANAWYASGNTEKAIQVVTSRMKLYRSTPQLEAMLEEYKHAIGYYDTLTIGGKTVNRSDTALLLKNVTLTEADTAAISELTHLVMLSLVNCGLTDISFLSNCNELMSLDLSDNPITDFSPLQNKEKLLTLYMDNTAISDFAQLHPISGLTTLSATGMWITVEELNALQEAMPDAEINAGHAFLLEKLTLGGVEFYSNVTELDLSGRGISDLTVLKKCIALEKLDLSDNNIGWLTALDEMSSLTYLDLSGNKLSNISGLKNHTGMTYLDVSDNRITDLSVVRYMPNLTEVYASNNLIYYGHKELGALTQLQKLTMANTQLQNSSMEKLPVQTLKELDIRSNKQLTADAVKQFATSSDCNVLHDFDN